MPKVVINNDYGGFGLSNEATIAYLKRKGKETHFYIRDSTNPFTFNKVNITDTDEHNELEFDPWQLLHVFTKDFGETFKTASFSDEGEHYFYDGDLERDDPDLVAVVEELGNKADGAYARLKVVEVPDDVNWQIKGYDGWEHVAENHRTWG